MSRLVTQAAERERELAKARSQRLKQAARSLPGESVSRGFAGRGALEGYPSHYTSLVTVSEQGKFYMIKISVSSLSSQNLEVIQQVTSLLATSKNLQFCNEQIRTQPLFSPPCASATYGSARMCRRKNRRASCLSRPLAIALIDVICVKLTAVKTRKSSLDR